MSTHHLESLKVATIQGDRGQIPSSASHKLDHPFQLLICPSYCWKSYGLVEPPSHEFIKFFGAELDLLHEFFGQLGHLLVEGEALVVVGLQLTLNLDFEGCLSLTRELEHPFIGEQLLHARCEIGEPSRLLLLGLSQASRVAKFVMNYPPYSLNFVFGFLRNPKHTSDTDCQLFSLIGLLLQRIRDTHLHHQNL
jgi:hypothetical protein